MSETRLRALGADAPVAPDRRRAIEAVRDLLAVVGADPVRAGMERTPERVADYYLALFAHVADDPAAEIGTPMTVGESDGLGTVSMEAIPFRSFCEHHLLPFAGTVDVTYAPARKLAGLSRLAGLVRSAAARPQLQERLTDDIADALVRALAPRGVEVRVRATHGCVGVGEPLSGECVVTTTATRGRPLDHT